MSPYDIPEFIAITQDSHKEEVETRRTKNHVPIESKCCQILFHNLFCTFRSLLTLLRLEVT